jgi:hypothetical protein
MWNGSWVVLRDVELYDNESIIRKLQNFTETVTAGPLNRKNLKNSSLWITGPNRAVSRLFLYISFVMIA